MTCGSASRQNIRQITRSGHRTHLHTTCSAVCFESQSPYTEYRQCFILRGLRIVGWTSEAQFDNRYLARSATDIVFLPMLMDFPLFEMGALRRVYDRRTARSNSNLQSGLRANKKKADTSNAVSALRRFKAYPGSISVPRICHIVSSVISPSVDAE
jgi:hypothetical protein